MIILFKPFWKHKKINRYLTNSFTKKWRRIIWVLWDNVPDNFQFETNDKRTIFRKADYVNTYNKYFLELIGAKEKIPS